MRKVQLQKPSARQELTWLAYDGARRAPIQQRPCEFLTVDKVIVDATKTRGLRSYLRSLRED